MLSFEIVTGGQKTPLIGAYLLLTTLDCLLYLKESLKRFPGRGSILIGNLNADINRLQKPCIKQVADLLVSFGLFNFLSHFRQQLNFCHMKTWWQVQQGRLLCSRCDCILGSDLWMFEAVGIRDPRNFSSNPFVLRARLLQRLT